MKTQSTLLKVFTEGYKDDFSINGELSLSYSATGNA